MKDIGKGGEKEEGKEKGYIKTLIKIRYEYIWHKGVGVEAKVL